MRLISLIILLFIPGLASAQAFGVKMGSPVSNYSSRPTDDPDSFIITPPQPNREFQEYLAIATPETGICKVVALGKDHKNDSYGVSVRTAYDGLSAALNGIYGTGKSFDFVKSGALWDQPREFVQSIYKNERRLVTFWSASSGAGFPPTISGVTLKAAAVNSTASYLVLSYEMINFNKCKQLFRANTDTGL